MLPSNTLSTFPVPGEFLAPDDQLVTGLIAKELGGVALSDPTEGLQVKVWTATYDGTSVFVGADDVAAVVQFSAPDITEIDLAFDQNMRAQIAFVQDGLSRFWWYDTAVNDHVFTDYPGAESMRVAMDDKRDMSNGQNDVILAYVRNNNLYFRAQRDRYGVEYLLKESVNGRLRRFGLSDKLRLQFEILLNPAEAADLTFEILADDDYVAAFEPFAVVADDDYAIPADDTFVAEFETFAIEADPGYTIPNEKRTC